MDTAANPLPTTLYQDLLIKLVAVLELTQRPEGTSTTQAKQAVIQATNDFKNSVNEAKEIASVLPGGELLIEEQDEVIEILTRLRDRKRDQLLGFSTQIVRPSLVNAHMEVDSVASTPFEDA